MPKLSAIIICRNESSDIRDCLESVKWCDEIIVLDSGSTDETVSLCQAYTPHVYETDWPGFGKQKNRALSYATGDWVLSIDADERVDETLAQEIKAVLDKPADYDGYTIPRKSTYCGRFIEHGSWRGDRVLRLFKREKARFSDDDVHEKVILQGTCGALQTPLLHYSFKDLSEVIAKMDSYSTAAANMRYAQGKRASIWTALFHGCWSFFRCYILKLGFLDGAEGLMLAISNAEGSYYRYVKLMLLTRDAEKKLTNPELNA